MLQGENVKLAPLRTADIPVLFEWINDRNEVLHSSAYRPVHEPSHEAWFEDIRQRKDVAIFGIRLIGSDQLIGSCQLLEIHPVYRTAELQIRIGVAESRGKGYGTEATRLLLRFAFCDLDLRRVCLHVLGTNARAIRMYEKCGFVREGLLRQAAHIDGNYVDVVVLGVLRDDG